MSVPGWLDRHMRAAGGVITVERFMELALYDPAAGYYMRAKEKIGRRGDFATAPSLSQVPGRAIARWMRTLGRRGPVDLLEIGAGTGALAKSILDALGWTGRRRVCYHIVEKSPFLKSQQALLLGRKVRWHDTVEEALEVVSNPVILSNELVDAFPFQVLEFDGKGWKEVGLGLSDGRLKEVLLPVADFDVLAVRCSSIRWMLANPPACGTRIEVQPAWQDWAAAWMPRVSGGDILTLDYGSEVPALHERRYRGSMRAYFQHMRMEGMEVYERAGHQDITADVNFTDLQESGRRFGLETVALQTQAAFLNQYAPREVARSAGAGKFLSKPGGAGDAFLVLHQRTTSGPERQP